MKIERRPEKGFRERKQWLLIFFLERERGTKGGEHVAFERHLTPPLEIPHRHPISFQKLKLK